MRHAYALRTPSQKQLFEQRMTTLGHVVRAIREEAGLSQDKLAERCHVDRQTINRVECARYAPQMITLWVIADGLGIPLSELIRRTEEELAMHNRGSAQ